MFIKSKKLNTGFSLPIYGFGTWQMGGREERDFANDDQADIDALWQAIELGVNHIDCAESYAAGHAEEIVGVAIKDYERSNLILASKAHADNLSYQDIIKACHNSLARMGVDYFDIYYAHRFNPNIPLEETMAGFDYLITHGLIKNIGVSNFNVEEMKLAQSLTTNKIVANQVHYNLKYREIEKRGVLQHCQENDMLVVAYRPLSKGILIDETNQEMLQKLANKYGATPTQIALSFLMSQPNVVTLSKTRDRQHLQENLDATKFELSSEDIEFLRINFPEQAAISDVVPLH